ncbi:MAG: UDP-N-acetylmuramoyl-L-alanine--D-glutamate ligase, partial [Acidimicrobiales bacterium]
SGTAAVAAGNIGRPLVEVASQALASQARGPRALGAEAAVPGVAVAEVSSFQLAWTRWFHPTVACWLNFAPDHLDWHADLGDYAAAKERIWRRQHQGDLAVANAEDPVVAKASAGAGGSVVTFGLRVGDYREEGGFLIVPGGEAVVAVAELPRRLPHDRANALAAAACALGAGGNITGCRAAVLAGVSLRHRIELVGTYLGVSYYDDSKATTPSAVCAALSGFESVVLVAGGRNKGLDLASIPAFLADEQHAGSGPGTARLRAVVALGEAAADVASAFAPIAPVMRVLSMDEAVAAAASVAGPGDAVLLSPGCASFDAYASYAERGDDFARAVAGHFAAARPAGREQR